jgi:hypothetical protein
MTLPAKPRYSLLDLGPDCQVSPAFDLTLRGKTVSAVFRELSQDSKDRLRIEAASYVETLRKSTEDVDGNKLDQDWLSEHLDTVLSNRWTALMVGSALRAPDDPTQPLFGADVLAMLPTGTITDLALKYEQWESNVSVLNVTPEAVDEFIAELKKNIPPNELWRRYGSSIQLVCLRHLVDQLETLPAGSVSAT